MDFDSIIKILVGVAVVIWLSLVYFTYSDARRRIADPVLVGLATLIAFIPFVGTIIYLIIRPPEYLDDVREREIEMAAAEARLHNLEFLLCPHCDAQVDKDFLRCPSCLRKLKDQCQTCAKPLDPEWRICPYCESEIAGVTPEPMRPRRRAPTAEEPAVTDFGNEFS